MVESSRYPARCGGRAPARCAGCAPARCGARAPARCGARAPARSPARCAGRSPARSWVGGSYHATLTALALALALAGCGGDSSDPCKAALTATFETVPNGLLPSAPLGGIDITSSGSVMVLRDGATTPPTPAVLIGNGGKVVLRARCDARSVELAFDDSDAPLTIDLYAGDDGGALGGDGGSSQPALRLDAAALVTTPDTATGYRRATLAFPSGGQIRRIELSSTGGPPTQGALIRLITFTP